MGTYIGKSQAQLDAEAESRRGRKSKGKGKKLPTLQSGRDGGTPEMRDKLRRMDALHIGHSPEGVARVQTEIQTPIDYYAHRGWITKRQKDAAVEFYHCWYYGGVKTLQGISRYDTQGGGSRDAYDVNQQLHDKYERAKKAIHGLPQALTCYNVVCIGEWASALSPRKLQFDPATGTVDKEELRPFYGSREQKMDWLRSALDDIADHWRMPV